MKHLVVPLFCLCVACLIVGCKNIHETTTPSLKPIPPTFGYQVDSLSSATQGWKEYFKDTILISLIDEAIHNNPDVLVSLQRLEAGRAGIQSAKGALLPTITANAAYLQRKFGLYTMDGAGNISTYIKDNQIVPIHLPDYYIGFQASWEADIWGKLRSKRRAALARYLSQAEGRNLVVTQLVAQVANAYYELLALDNELVIVKETITIQEKALDLAAVQKEVAAANELAVMQFKDQLLNSQAMEYEIKQRIVEFESRINFLLGRFPQPIIRNSKAFSGKSGFQPKLGQPSDLIFNRPDVKQAELQVKAAKADVDAAKRAFYPSIGFSGSLGYQAFQPSLLFQTPESIAYSLLANLAFPLINRSAIKANFRVATAAQVEALYNYQKTILQAYMEVAVERSRIENLGKLVEIKTEQANVISRSVEISAELFKTNRANYLEVLLTQRGALEKRLDLVNMRLRQFNAGIDMYRALGGGWR